ncbi:unnamed protein product, partial [Staurois parvus]
MSCQSAPVHPCSSVCCCFFTVQSQAGKVRALSVLLDVM